MEKPNIKTSEKWVSLHAIAEHLSVSDDTVRIWIKDGTIPAYKMGKMYRFRISEIDEQVLKGKIMQ